MYKCNYKTLKLSFNEFHSIEDKDMPEDGVFCFLELKDGSYTAGRWMSVKAGDSVSGQFIRGTGDTVSADEVSWWHLLHSYDLSNCLEDEDIGLINIGAEKEGAHTVEIKGFKSLSDGDFPNDEQYCLLIFKDGGLAAGRWNKWLGENRGSFIYAPALASYSMDDVWAWTALSTDPIYAVEEERINARKREEELNRNPSVDHDKFIYGTDVNAYYEKALERLRKDYPWASLAQMRKEKIWEITPLHGKYVFGHVSKACDGNRIVEEWTDGSTAEEFIDFLYERTKDTVRKSNPEEKFKYGTDIEVYLEKAFANVKKNYHWLDKKTAEEFVSYKIEKVDGDWEYLWKFSTNDDYSICYCSSGDGFIKSVEHEYERAALRANPVVAEYDVPFGQIDINGWYLEKYVVSKLKTGDYKVNVQAGNRSTGGNREFFISPDCFEAKTYDEFLDRYLQIVPGGSFGLAKEDLLPNEELKSFFGY